MNDTDLPVVHLNAQWAEFILAQFWRVTGYRANGGISIVRERGVHIPAHILRMERGADPAFIPIL